MRRIKLNSQIHLSLNLHFNAFQRLSRFESIEELKIIFRINYYDSQHIQCLQIMAINCKNFKYLSIVCIYDNYY